MRGKPDAAVLIRHLGSQQMRRVPAEIKHRGLCCDARSLGFFRQVKISGDIKAGQALEDELLDPLAGAIELPGDLNLQRRAMRQRLQAKHVAQLLAAQLLLLRPIGERTDVTE